MYVCNDCITKHVLNIGYWTTTGICEICQKSFVHLVWTNDLYRVFEGDGLPSVEEQLVTLKQHKAKTS